MWELFGIYQRIDFTLGSLFFFLMLLLKADVPSPTQLWPGAVVLRFQRQQQARKYSTLSVSLRLRLHLSPPPLPSANKIRNFSNQLLTGENEC